MNRSDNQPLADSKELTAAADPIVITGYVADAPAISNRQPSYTFRPAATPFNRAKLKGHHPGMDQLLAKLWGLQD